MRILLVSDLHYSLKQLDWVVSVADEYDLVVLAGDHLDIRSYVEPDAQIVVVLEYLSRLAAKTTVAACSGNHDLNARNELDERAAVWLQARATSGVYVDGTSIVDRRRAHHRVPVVGRAAHARAVRRRARGRSRRRSATACGSGCTTRRPTSRRRAGPAAATTATRT